MKKAVSLLSFLSVLGVLLFAFACGKTDLVNTVTENKTPENKTNATTNTSPNTASNNSAGNSTSTETTTVAKDISGKYTVEGRNEGGAGNYKGDLTVQKRGDVYQFSWNTAGKLYDGVGVQTGNAVAVAFTEGKNGEGCGVVLYKINSDGALDGKAGYWGENKMETETAKRTSGSDLVGEYDVKGKNPAGNEYTAKLSVKQQGSGYAFSWTGSNELEGFGIKQGNFVAVGIGGKQCGFVSYEVKSDGTLDGKWGGYGSTSVGTETAKKK